MHSEGSQRKRRIKPQVAQFSPDRCDRWYTQRHLTTRKFHSHAPLLFPGSSFAEHSSRNHARSCGAPISPNGPRREGAARAGMQGDGYLERASSAGRKGRNFRPSRNTSTPRATTPRVTPNSSGVGQVDHTSVDAGEAGVPGGVLHGGQGGRRSPGWRSGSRPPAAARACRRCPRWPAAMPPPKGRCVAGPGSGR